ncbi:MAG: restriction endonuclease subunit S [Bryobacteraceae bacterium]
MTPDLLIEHFDRISDAPDAIARLRQFILELAVRGKLVDRDPLDEPVLELLERVQKEKLRRAANSSPKQHTPLPRVGLKEAWFDIPEYWSWVRLGEVTQVVMGQSPPGESYNRIGEGIPLINGPVEFTEGPFGRTFINQYTTAPTNLCEEGDLLLCVRGSTTGRTNVAGFRACIGRGVAAIRPFFNDHYIRLFIWRLRPSIIAMGRGIAFPSVNRDQIVSLPIPLPPLGEQERIVAKVDELMALCDRLEAAQAEREVRRRSLVSAANHHLANGDDPESFRAHARFCFDSLPRLTSRLEHIKQFRETILSLAVRGQLTRGELTDAPAAELLTTIQHEKDKVSEAGGLKKDKELWDGLPKTPPYNIPENWVWTRLQDVFEISRGGSPRPAGDPRYFGGSIPWITVGEITKDKGKYLTNTEGTLTEEGSTRSRFINPGDLLLTNSGATLGVPKISTIKACMNDGVAVLRLFHSVPLNDFAYLFLQSQTQRFRAINQGMGQPNLNTPIIAGWFFPLPPLAEQRRIVERVELLMALCDELEIRLTSDAEVGRQLLEAVLSKALGITKVSEGRGFGADKKTKNLSPEEGKLHERTI